jgi:hypothetical protein
MTWAEDRKKEYSMSFNWYQWRCIQDGLQLYLAIVLTGTFDAPTGPDVDQLQELITKIKTQRLSISD